MYVYIYTHVYTYMCIHIYMYIYAECIPKVGENGEDVDDGHISILGGFEATRATDPATGGRLRMLRMVPCMAGPAFLAV